MHILKVSVLEDEGKKLGGKHYVLVHGACHGAWCWFKVKPLLEEAGHRVTTLDMAASGIHPATIHQLHTLRDYCRPLIDFMGSLPDDQKVILVGHSLGGLNVAVIIEMFPYKIEAAVFLAAFLPDTHHHPAFVVDQFAARLPEDFWLDTEFKSTGDPNESLTTMLFGPKFVSLLYHLTPLEDFELGMMLKRPSSFFLHDLRKADKFSKEKHESVRRVYVACEEDKAITKDFQLWMVENGGVKEVKELKGSDHMPMLSMPQKLSDCLIEIARKC